MFRKDKCRRCNAGTTTAVFRPQDAQVSCSTTITPRQESAPPRCPLSTSRYLALSLIA